VCRNGPLVIILVCSSTFKNGLSYKLKNVIVFSFTKLEKRKAEQVLPRRRLVPVGGGRRWGKGIGG
jgi:hypothetical protein